jgi:hypothetical protein
LAIGPQMVDAPANSVAFAYAGMGAMAIAIVAAAWLYVRRQVSRVDL